MSFDGDLSKCGVKQACVMAPCLFNTYFSYLLRNAFGTADRETGVLLHARYDGGVFNAQRFHAKTKINNTLFSYLIFADDVAILAHSTKIFNCLSIHVRFSA